jgi:hypothetical protein
MSKRFTLEQLTEGIRQRHLGAANARLVEKWSRTGLLRGLQGTARENMSMLLENQAAQLLREANSLSTGGASGVSSGDIRGFTNIAFPIVRRVFGGLVANELVSIQPMSLPSGLLFYLDYTYGSDVGGDAAESGTGNLRGTTGASAYQAGQSIYNNPAGKGIRSGSLGVGGQYDLAGSGYSRAQGQLTGSTSGLTADGRQAFLAIGAFNDGAGTTASTLTAGSMCYATGTDGKLLQFDPQLTDLIEKGSNPGAANNPGGSAFQFAILSITGSVLDDAKTDQSNTGYASADRTQAKEWGLNFASRPGDKTLTAAGVGHFVVKRIPESIQGGALYNVRRLNQLGTYTAAGGFVRDPLVSTSTANAAVLMVVSGNLNNRFSTAAVAGTDPLDSMQVSFPLSPTLNAPAGGADGTLVIPTFESDFGTTPSPAIPEIDIKIESIAVTAVTRKLRARWSPELAQDLNAYHSLDAEVELTQILSEQIALELDREILNDLLTQANGANLYWSRAPGKFVNKETGAIVARGTSLQPGPAFTGTVREWYETLIETIIDCANQIHRKTLRGSANFIVVGPDVATILEASVLYRPEYSLDGDGQVGSPMTIGTEKVGTLSNRFTVYKDPYFPRNQILVGYKGGSYLETGYVYAPYVPLIVTPTIFAPEDFTPRKGVMTRYGKKMVRSDFYGTVTCLDMNVI